MKRKIIAAAMAVTLTASAAISTSVNSFSDIAITANAVQESADYAGVYDVAIQLYNYSEDKVSMGNAALLQTAQLVVNEDKTASLEISFQSMVYLGQNGYLGEFRKVTNVTKTNKFGVPTEVETEPAKVLEEYTGVYDCFNNPEDTSRDENVVGKWYPKKVSIPIDVMIDETTGKISGVAGYLSSFYNEDEVNYRNSVLVQVYVPVMESLGEGGGTKLASLVLDWDSLEKQSDVSLNGYSLSLSGDIGLNFFLDLSDNVISDSKAKVCITLPDGTVNKIPISSATKSENGYQFTANVAAKEMASDVTTEVILGDGTSVGTFTQSVKGYADDMLSASDETYSAETISLVKAMLNYGGYAQTYFNYNTANPANIGLTSAEKSLSSINNLSSYKYSVSGSESGIVYSGSKLSLESETSIKHYFTLTGSKTIDKYTFKVNGKTVTPVKSGNMYYITVENISAKNLANNYTVKIGGLTLNYSAMSYANSALTKTSKTALQNVTKALYLYNQAAVSYTK
jgi:hypothetical protein